MLTTTIAGSLPKPSWLVHPRQLWAEWRLEDDELAEAKRDAVRLAVADQVSAGIDIITDGEQTRRHFVTAMIDALDGVDFEQTATVKIRRRYEANVPRVVGEVSRSGPVFVADATYLRTLTDRPLKWQLPGPMTMVDTLADEYYGDREALAYAFADILNQEARELAAAGIDVIQFDEPAWNVFMDDVAAWGIAAFERAIEGVSAKSVVHICYGYGISANIEWKQGLGEQWRQYESTFPLIAASSIDGVSLELANSHVPDELLGLLEGKDVLVGVIDVATDQIETPRQVADTIHRALEYLPAERLHPCTNCGMVPLSPEIARAKMRALADGAAIAREELT